MLARATCKIQWVNHRNNPRIPCTSQHTHTDTHTHTQPDFQDDEKKGICFKGLTLVSTVCLESLPLFQWKERLPSTLFSYTSRLQARRRWDQKAQCLESEDQMWVHIPPLIPRWLWANSRSLLTTCSSPFKNNITYTSNSQRFLDDH